MSGAATVGNLVADTGNVNVAIGNLLMSSTAAQSITHTGTGGKDFSIVSTNGNIVIASTNNHVSVESMIVAAGVVTGVSSLDVSGAATVGAVTVDTGALTVDLAM